MATGHMVRSLREEEGDLFSAAEQQFFGTEFRDLYAVSKLVPRNLLGSAGTVGCHKDLAMGLKPVGVSEQRDIAVLVDGKGKVVAALDGTGREHVLWPLVNTSAHRGAPPSDSSSRLIRTQLSAEDSMSRDVAIGGLSESAVLV